ncbi:MAG: hypothetical protein KDA96_09925 [Planctomycetaceae bacterium]|nr:hypothetical protein [Planctomycetaceae bacterium]
MPFPTLPPFPPNTTVLPTCPTALLYSIGNLYYYATADCTDATNVGTGVSDSVITGTLGCQGSECQCSPIDPTVLGGLMSPSGPGSDVVSRLVSLMFGNATGQGNGNGKPHPFPGRGQRGGVKQAQKYLARMSGRPDINERRKEILGHMAVIASPTSGKTNLEEWYDLPEHFRDAYLAELDTQLRKVEDNSQTKPHPFKTLDRRLNDNVVPLDANENIATLFDDHKSGATAKDGEFKGRGGSSAFVQILLPQLQNATTSETAYFRIQRVDGPNNEYTHYVGQQVESLPQGTDGDKLHEAIWVDRHSHFHTIRATPDGGDEVSIFVYSAYHLSSGDIIP